MTWLISLLLQFVPAPAGQILAVLLPVLIKAEVQEAQPIILALVKQAEADPALDTGLKKFEWVAENAAIQIAKAQIKVAQDVVNLLIEGAVQQIKASG